MYEGIFTRKMKISKRHLKLRIFYTVSFSLSFSSESKTRKLLSHWVEPFALPGTALFSSFQKCKDLPRRLLSHVLPLEDRPRITDSWKPYLFSGFWHQWMFFKWLFSIIGMYTMISLWAVTKFPCSLKSHAWKTGLERQGFPCLWQLLFDKYLAT